MKTANDLFSERAEFDGTSTKYHIKEMPALGVFKLNKYLKTFQKNKIMI